MNDDGYILYTHLNVEVGRKSNVREAQRVHMATLGSFARFEYI